MGRITMAVGLLAATLFSGCKDNSPGAVDFSKSPALVGFQYKGFQETPLITAIYGNSKDSTTLQVTLSVASLTLKSAVTLDLVPDPDFITSYNAANGTAYSLMSSSLYTLPNGGHVTIAPGQQIVTLSIHFAGQNVDFSKSTALALKITNVVGATVATNLDEVIMPIVLKSIYAATYEASGTRHHPVLGDFSFDYDVAMSTVNKTTIDGPALADLAVDLQIQVNPDNTVIVTSPGGGGQPTTQNSPGLVNVYNPSTKTFTLNYFYNTSAPRTIKETLKYVGP